jgi:hypothetical protein
MEDRTEEDIGCMIFDVLAGEFEALADKFVGQFPNPEDREGFKESVVRDLANPDYRLYTVV